MKLPYEIAEQGYYLEGVTGYMLLYHVVTNLVYDVRQTFERKKSERL
jgi:hypothetical protein